MISASYLNLPIKNVAATDAFMSALGFAKDERFASEDTTNARISSELVLMLLEEKRFSGFTKKSVPDAVATPGFIIAVQVESKEAVTALHAAALSAGAVDTHYENTVDFMFGQGFADINGHRWEVFVMHDMPAA